MIGTNNGGRGGSRSKSNVNKHPGRGKSSDKPVKKTASSQSSVPVDGNENCGKCSAEIQEGDHGLQCERCDTWYCISCLNLSENEYEVLSLRADLHWFCDECENKALHAVRNDQEIEERCNTYMKNINERLERNETEIKTKASINQLATLEEKIQGEITSLKDNIQQLKPGTSDSSSGNGNIIGQVCTQLKDRDNRANNLVIYRAIESTSNLKDERIKHDKEIVDKLYIATSHGSLNHKCRRLGKKALGPTREDGTLQQNRPLLVTFETNDDKMKVMKNLQALRSAEDMLKVLSVAHDMSKEEREVNNKLRVEAKKLNDENEEENFIYVVRGEPWNRKIQKVRKRNT